VPFQLDKDATRRGETHVHKALREALVNTLIHADHQSTRPIKIIKLSTSFEFSNPGRLRISLWKEQQWLIPLVSENLELEMTSITLLMVSLIPENVERDLSPNIIYQCER